jgi:hypothetical protein
VKRLRPAHVEVEISRVDELMQRRGLTSEIDEIVELRGQESGAAVALACD